MLGDDEHRRFKRMSVDANAKVIVGSGEHEKIYDAVCQDLSATGVSLQLSAAIEEGEAIVIYIKSGGPIASLKARATVIRSTMVDNGDYQLGCEITEML